MLTKNVHYYLVKLARLSGWLLFVLMLLYIVTGFVLCGEPGFANLCDPRTALRIHKIFEWPLVGAFLTHSAITIYFALRRWGWIKTKRKTMT